MGEAQAVQLARWPRRSSLPHSVWMENLGMNPKHSSYAGFHSASVPGLPPACLLPEAGSIRSVPCGSPSRRCTSRESLLKWLPKTRRSWWWFRAQRCRLCPTCGPPRPDPRSRPSPAPRPGARGEVRAQSCFLPRTRRLHLISPASRIAHLSAIEYRAVRGIKDRRGSKNVVPSRYGRLPAARER